MFPTSYVLPIKRSTDRWPRICKQLAHKKFKLGGSRKESGVAQQVNISAVCSGCVDISAIRSFSRTWLSSRSRSRHISISFIRLCWNSYSFRRQPRRIPSDRLEHSRFSMTISVAVIQTREFFQSIENVIERTRIFLRKSSDERTRLFDYFLLKRLSAENEIETGRQIYHLFPSCFNFTFFVTQYFEKNAVNDVAADFLQLKNLVKRQGAQRLPLRTW